jgi:hypothetical protein
MIVRLKFITKQDHFICKEKIIYNKTVQPSMSGFQMTGYSSDVRLANGLWLWNSGLNLNRAFYNQTCLEIGCSLYLKVLAKVNKCPAYCQLGPFSGRSAWASSEFSQGVKCVFTT